MAFQFRKLISPFLFVSTLSACCCVGYIHSTTANIQNYIENQNLNIATQYLVKINQELKQINQNLILNNKAIKNIVNIEYNTNVSDGILLKEKKYNFLLHKLNLMNSIYLTK